MSKTLFSEAKKYIAGGVNSPVRAFKGLGMDPIFIKEAKGKFFVAENGRSYLDFCLSWGPMILGHAHADILRSVRAQMCRGTSFGVPTRIETQLAKRLCALVPSIEQVRFTSSGTEAAMSAVRLARGYTRRPLIIKFDGGYHGHADSFLVKAGSGLAGKSHGSSDGVPDGFVKNTISLPYNNLALVEKTIKRIHKQCAAVIVEPVPGNMGVILPKEGFLEGLRILCSRYNVLLIFDEVISGFRVGLGGAQQHFGITPDLTILGKIIGGGFPVGAFGGKREIMRCLAPEGAVYQAGTLSGNPVAMAAGLATVTYLEKHASLYRQMSALVSDFSKEWVKKVPLTLNHIGSMFTIFYTRSPVQCYMDALGQDKRQFLGYYRKLLKSGLYMPPSMFEAAFLSLKHTGQDLERLLKIFTR